MTQRNMSLVDILSPPRNKWLRQLARRKSDLPVGVRVVRFSNNVDDDDLDGPETIASVPARQDQAPVAG
jgi:hypothetical protein